MKKFLGLLSLLVIISAIAIYFYEKSSEPQQGMTSGDVKREAQEALEATKQFTQKKKEEYQAALEVELQELEQNISDLRRKADDAGVLKLEQHDETIAALQEKKETLQQQLKMIKSVSAAKWQEMKTDLDSAMTDLRDAYKRALSRFK
jgi:predicted sulfurtransferase